MSKAQSNKKKGRDGQYEIRDLLLTSFPELEEDDIRSTPMGAPGEDLLLSPAARKLLKGIQIEVKRSKRISAMRWVEQAIEHGKHIPTVFFREDGRGKEPYVIISASFFIELLKR